MAILWILAVLSLIFGILLLFAPKAFVNLSKKANEVIVSMDEKLYSIRIGLGISLIAISLTSFFVIYYIVIKY